MVKSSDLIVKSLQDFQDKSKYNRTSVYIFAYIIFYIFKIYIKLNIAYKVILSYWLKKI